MVGAETPGTLREASRGHVWAESGGKEVRGLFPESRVLDTNRGQRMGGEMGWAGPELAHPLIKLSCKLV